MEINALTELFPASDPLFVHNAFKVGGSLEQLGVLLLHGIGVFNYPQTGIHFSIDGIER
jgi:hypothetical protein